MSSKPLETFSQIRTLDPIFRGLKHKADAEKGNFKHDIRTLDPIFRGLKLVSGVVVGHGLQHQNT